MPNSGNSGVIWKINYWDYLTYIHLKGLHANAPNIT